MGKTGAQTTWRSVRPSNGTSGKGHENKIVTARYTSFTFLPKSLFEQFRKTSNFFFLFMVIIQLTVPVPTNPSLYILTFAAIVSVSICRAGYEDWLRHRSDDLVNNRPTHVFDQHSNTVESSKFIQVGQVIRLQDHEDLPADMLLLAAVSPSGALMSKCEITTANLDGEPTLKIRLCALRYPPTQLHDSAILLETLFQNDLVVEYDQPNADLYKFSGRLFWTQNSSQSPLPLTMDNVLLRGTTVKNAQFVYGLVLYTGEDTRLSLNSRSPRLGKFSVVDTAINRSICFMAVLLLLLTFTSMGYGIHYFRSSTFVNAWYLPVYDGSETILGIHTTLLFLILYSSFIPISLSVSVEIQKFMSSLFFGWDEALHCPTTATAPLANNSDVVEELGQINYLLTDKTGTLTENNLNFVCCSIGGTKYKYNRYKGKYSLSPSPEAKEANKNSAKSDVEEFFLALALCHTVQAVSKEDKVVYQGTSSDEEVLVAAAHALGITFSGEDHEGNLIIKQNGIQDKFKRHLVFEFDSDRKCMSVIVEDEGGKFFLITKGAETALLPKCNSNSSPFVLQNTFAHVNQFAQKGFRTLLVGKREILHSEYLKIRSKVTELCHNSEELNSFYAETESELRLLGVSGVEDKLQDGVPETLKALRLAGIRIWMLTGDKMETAINIALTSGLIKCRCLQYSSSSSSVGGFCPCIENLINISFPDVLKSTLQTIRQKLEQKQSSRQALVIDSISFCNGYENCRELLAEVLLRYEEIVFCRMTPLQKAQVVRLTKHETNSSLRVCAVGDGGNDVAMIQEAHVAVGIMGKEGWQAARAADFAVPKFQHLRKAILVHGSWNYERLVTLVNYFFYRAFLLAMPQLMYAFRNGFSGQPVFDSSFMMFYALLFSSLPVLIYGISEKRFSEEELQGCPELYNIWRGNALMSWKWILYYAVLTLWHVLLVINLPGFIWQNEMQTLDWAVYSHLTNALVLLVTDLKLVTRTVTFTWIVLVGQIASFGGMLLFYVLTSEVFGSSAGGLLKFAYFPLLSRPGFWYLCFLTTVLAVLPDLIEGAMRRVEYRNRIRRLSSLTLESSASA